MATLGTALRSVTARTVRSVRAISGRGSTLPTIPEQETHPDSEVRIVFHVFAVQCDPLSAPACRSNPQRGLGNADSDPEPTLTNMG